MNGKGMTYLMIALILGGFSFTFVTGIIGKRDLAEAVADRNERIKELREELGPQLKSLASDVTDIRISVKALECAQGLPSCTPVRSDGRGR